MLCPGIRPFFDIAESEHYGALRILDVECYKRIARKSSEHEDARLKATSIPPAAIAQARNGTLPQETVERFINLCEADNSLNFLLDDSVSPLSYAPSSATITRNLFQIMVAMCDVGLRPKFLYPQWWYGHVLDWNSLGFDQIHTADFLYVERLDVKGGTDYARGEVFAAVQQRVASCLPTVVTLGPNPVGRNDTETELLKEITAWQQLKF
jgi:hypothetical protein